MFHWLLAFSKLFFKDVSDGVGHFCSFFCTLNFNGCMKIYRNIDGQSLHFRFYQVPKRLLLNGCRIILGCMFIVFHALRLYGFGPGLSRENLYKKFIEQGAAPDGNSAALHCRR